MERRTMLAFLATSFLLLAMLAEIPALAQPTGPTADVRIDDATGASGTNVVVPVIIANVANGPIQGIRLKIDYNEKVLNLTSISTGDLTPASTWISQLGTDLHTLVVATAYNETAIPTGSSGSVVRLNFKVTGSAGKTSRMNLTLIELANPEGVLGNASTKNGTFTVTSATSTPTTSPVTYGGGGSGGYFVPPITPTPKSTPGDEKETELEAPSSASRTPESISSEAPTETPSSVRTTVPWTPPLFILLIVTGVIGVVGILIMVLRRR